MLCAAAGSRVLTASLAAATAGFVNRGSEEFESGTLVPGRILPFDDPLTPKIDNCVLPAATNPAIGMAVPSNSLGGAGRGGAGRARSRHRA